MNFKKIILVLILINKSMNIFCASKESINIKNLMADLDINSVLKRYKITESDLSTFSKKFEQVLEELLKEKKVHLILGLLKDAGPYNHSVMSWLEKKSNLYIPEFMQLLSRYYFEWAIKFLIIDSKDKSLLKKHAIDYCIKAFELFGLWKLVFKQDCLCKDNDYNDFIFIISQSFAPFGRKFKQLLNDNDLYGKILFDAHIKANRDFLDLNLTPYTINDNSLSEEKCALIKSKMKNDVQNSFKDFIEEFAAKDKTEQEKKSKLNNSSVSSKIASQDVANKVAAAILDGKSEIGSDGSIVVNANKIPLLKRTCFNCKKVFQEKLGKCANCLKVYYCSGNCQLLDFQQHKIKCINNNQANSKTSNDSNKKSVFSSSTCSSSSSCLVTGKQIKSIHRCKTCKKMFQTEPLKCARCYLQRIIKFGDDYDQNLLEKHCSDQCIQVHIKNNCDANSN